MPELLQSTSSVHIEGGKVYERRVRDKSTLDAWLQSVNHIRDNPKFAADFAGVGRWLACMQEEASRALGFDNPLPSNPDERYRVLLWLKEHYPEGLINVSNLSHFKPR